jgi:hypothetical protein
MFMFFQCFDCVIFVHESIHSDGTSKGASVRAFSRFKFIVFKVTHALQSYGGAVSFVVGAYLWSSSSFEGVGSVCTVGDTMTSRLSVLFKNIHIFDSSAVAFTFGGKSLITSTMLVHKCTTRSYCIVRCR